jgi:hypothetical protein
MLVPTTNKIKYACAVIVFIFYHNIYTVVTYVFFYPYSFPVPAHPSGFNTHLVKTIT